MRQKITSALKDPERFAVAVRDCEGECLIAAVSVMLGLTGIGTCAGIPRGAVHVLSYKNSLRRAGFLFEFSGFVLDPEHVRLVQQSLIDAFLDDPGINAAALQVRINGVIVFRRLWQLQLFRVRMLLRCDDGQPTFRLTIFTNQRFHGVQEGHAFIVDQEVQRLSAFMLRMPVPLVPFDIKAIVFLQPVLATLTHELISAGFQIRDQIHAVSLSDLFFCVFAHLTLPSFPRECSFS